MRVLELTDRVVRDEILTSERYWAVSIEAQRLFVHLILCADDTGRFSGKNYTIRAACFPGQAVQAEKIEKLLSELQDADLVRVYQHDSDRFLFIPRFRQRLRYFHSRYPEPPKEISDIVLEKTDLGPTAVGPKSDSSQRKRSEEKRREEIHSTFVLPDWVPTEPWKAWLEVRARVKAPNTFRALTIALRDLTELRDAGNDPKEVLERATLKGWRGLFPVRKPEAPAVKVDL